MSDLFDHFLQEVHGLEEFRARYLSAYPFAPLRDDDPEVRRLVEAMAYYSARTRQEARREVSRLNQRLFRQHFPYLLAPLPAVGLLRAEPTPRLVEPTVLPAGSLVRVDAPDGSHARFATRHEVRLQPLTIERSERQVGRDGSVRWLFHFRGSRPDAVHSVGTLDLFVHQLGDFWQSARVLEELRDKLRRVGVIYGGLPEADDEGEQCRVRVGLPAPGDGPEGRDGRHPIEVIRDHFNQPQQDHFVRVSVPPSEQPWTRFTLVFTLDEAWPDDLLLNRSTFRLFVTPIVNLRRAEAAPIALDGKARRHLVQAGEGADGSRLHSVTGVYELLDGVPQPLRPGVIPGPRGCWELEPGAGEDPYLVVRSPQAWLEPRTLTVDARWFDPGFSRWAGEDLPVRPFSRVYAGVEWSLLGGLKAHVPVPDDGEDLALLKALSLRMASSFGLDEVRALLDVLGCLPTSPLGDVAERLVSVTARETSHGFGHTLGLRYEYDLQFTGLRDADLHRVRALLRPLRALLSAWKLRGEVRLLGRSDGARGAVVEG